MLINSKHDLISVLRVHKWQIKPLPVKFIVDVIGICLFQRSKLYIVVNKFHKLNNSFCKRKYIRREQKGGKTFSIPLNKNYSTLI